MLFSEMLTITSVVRLTYISHSPRIPTVGQVLCGAWLCRDSAPQTHAGSPRDRSERPSEAFHVAASVVEVSHAIAASWELNTST